MSKNARALRQLPPATVGALEKLGADLAVARLRRRESLRSWAQRLGVTVSTLQRLEAGDPAVSIGIVATALWLIRRDSELAKLAAPEGDLGALELDVREAVELGRARARASAEARLRAKSAKDSADAPGSSPTPARPAWSVDFLKMAATSASVSYGTPLTPEGLAQIVLSGKVPATFRPHLRALLEEAPAGVLEGLIDQLAKGRKRTRIQRNLSALAADVGSPLRAKDSAAAPGSSPTPAPRARWGPW